MPVESGKSSKQGREVSVTAVEEKGAGQARTMGAGQQLMDLDFVRGLITAVDESGIDSLEINRAGTRIRIAKTPAPVVVQGGGAAASVPAAPLAAVQPAAPVAAAAPAAATPPAAESGAAPAPAANDNLIDVTSPMVGTFYRAPAPEAPPYVEVGSTVSKGQTLCILEAMKLMNELEAEVDGIVREILVSNAEPVEYGQVLFRIEPVNS